MSLFKDDVNSWLSFLKRIQYPVSNMCSGNTYSDSTLIERWQRNLERQPQCAEFFLSNLTNSQRNMAFHIV